MKKKRVRAQQTLLAGSCIVFEPCSPQTMAAGDNDTEKLLEEYKKEQAECRQDLKEDERVEYDARTPEEKTEWLRCDITTARAAACVGGLHGGGAV